MDIPVQPLLFSVPAAVYLLFGQRRGRAVRETLRQLSWQFFYLGWKLTLTNFLLAWLREAIYFALGEEILFRGFLGGWLMRRFGFAVGNILQTLAFMLPHLTALTLSLSLWPLLISQGLIGWLLGWLRHRSESILPGWLAHGLMNAVTVMIIMQ